LDANALLSYVYNQKYQQIYCTTQQNCISHEFGRVLVQQQQLRQTY